LKINSPKIKPVPPPLVQEEYICVEKSAFENALEKGAFSELREQKSVY
jgi:hypothetical protein